MTGKNMHRAKGMDGRLFRAATAALYLLCLVAWPSHALGAYAVGWYVVDSCGVAGTSPSYRMHAAVGQPVAGTCGGMNYGVGVGYLGRVAADDPMTDISVRKTVDNADPIEGATITYTVSCWNNGPSDSTGIQVTDSLPSGVTYVSHTASGSTYDPVSGVWDLGPVTASGWLRLYITATVDSGTTGQTIVNTATVTASDITDPDPGNDTDSASITVGFGVHYVDPNGTHDSPFVNWGTAATTIQAAVDLALDGSMVLVSNGVYTTGGDAAGEFLLTNRVYIAKDILVRSVNGPEFTHIVGEADPVYTNGPGSMRCAYLYGDARLEGFTLRDGHTYGDDPEFYDPNAGGLMLKGGGTVSNCVIRNCSSHGAGGGVYADDGGLTDCTIVSNRCSSYAGGMYMTDYAWANRCRILQNHAESSGGGVGINEFVALAHCLVAGNTAGGKGGGISVSWDGDIEFCTIVENHAGDAGGGLYANDNASVVASILYRNMAGTSDSNWFDKGSASYYHCCTVPDPGGTGHVLSNPLLVDATSGNYRLQGGSPCIDALEPGWLGTDLDGIVRPLDGDNDGSAVSDIGCHEFAHESADADSDGMGDGFEVRYGLDPRSGGDALGNLDGDPHSNLQEAVADTDPTNSNAYLRITGILPHPGGVDVQWQGGEQARQVLESRADPETGNWAPIRTNEPPTPVNANFVDPAGPAERHYRINAVRP